MPPDLSRAISLLPLLPIPQDFTRLRWYSWEDTARSGNASNRLAPGTPITCGAPRGSHEIILETQTRGHWGRPGALVS